MEANPVERKQLITSVIAVIAFEVIAAALMSTNRFHPLAVQGLARLAQTAMMISIVFVPRKSVSSIGLELSGMLYGLKRGLIWSAAFGLVVALGSAVLIIFKTDPRALIHVELPENQNDIILFFIVGGVLAPVAEEILFRGLLYGFFRQWGVAVALLTSTSFFVLAHLTTSGVSLIQVIGGILFAASYELGKNLWSPITIHILGNLSIFALSL